MLVQPCVRNAPGKIDEASPSGYSLHPRENGPAVFQGPGGVTTSQTLLGPVLVWSQQNYLRLLLTVRYLAPRLSLKKNWAQKTMNEWLCRPALKLSIYETVFILFAKSECLIQIFKHFWTELAFLRKSVQSIRHRRENGVDTLKIHRDTLLKTSKNTDIV